jgi:tetratricopeptide (TPR) repeat protein
MTKCPHCGADVEDSIQTLLQRAAQLAQGGNNEAAAEFYEQVLHADQYQLDAYYRLGAIQFEMDHYEAAIYTFENALQLWPAMSSLAHNIAIAMKQLGRDQEAIAYFEKALALVDNDQRINAATKPALKQTIQAELEKLRPKKSGLKFW